MVNFSFSKNHIFCNRTAVFLVLWSSFEAVQSGPTVTASITNLHKSHQAHIKLITNIKLIKWMHLEIS